MSDPPRKRQRISNFESVNGNSPQISSSQSSSNNHNLNHRDDVQNIDDNNIIQQSAISLPQPLQRKKSRKKKPTDKKINDVITKCREDIGNLQLVKVICIDDKDMKWWYCTICNEGKSKEDVKFVKYVVVRTITGHLRANTHHKKLKGELLKLDNDRIRKETDKEKKSKEMSDIYNDINKLHNTLIMNDEGDDNEEQKALQEYYPVGERNWMRAERDLIEPKNIHGLSGNMLLNYGNASIDVLLKCYGKNKLQNNKQFESVINAKSCKEEYNDWKLFAIKETSKVIALDIDYDRILLFYRYTHMKYGSNYPNWYQLYDRILLNYNSSMSLERIFRVRNLYQLAICSKYSYDGLTHRLRLYHNSPEPGTVESIILYIKALNKWNNMKGKRFYSAVSPIADSRFIK